jgi:hypothetical protein
MRQRRIEITVETRQIVIRRRVNQGPVWCLECSSAVQALPPEEAALSAAVSTRMVYRWVEAGRLHLIEAAEQAPLICLNSLLRLTDLRRKNPCHKALH